MAFTYSKLDSELTRSSIWDQESDIRVVWITMLSLKDKDGFVSSSVPGLAHLSRVSIDKAREALDMFLAPDEYSRTTDNEGRRIKETDGGWIVLNHAKYRDQQNRDQRKADQAEYARVKRASSKVVGASTSVDKRRQESTYTDTDTNTNTDSSSKHTVEVSTVIAKAKAGYSIEFEQFWQAYPSDRRGNKKRAFIEWKKVPDDKRQLVIDDIDLRVKVDKVFIDEGGKFVPHAERWLSGERWETGIKQDSGFGSVNDKNIQVGLDWLKNG